MTLSAVLGGALVILLTFGAALVARRNHVDPDLLRTHRMAGLADQTGWSFSATDVFDYAAMPFGLFRWHPGGRAANVLVGETGDGRPVCAFDFEVPDLDGSGNRSFTCVIADTGATWPRLVVQPRDRRRRFPSLDLTLTDLLPDVEAHDAFRVWSSDEAFARLMLDSPLGEWLETTWPDVHFEVSSGLLLVWSSRRSVRRIHEALSSVDALRSRVPVTIWEQYPAERPHR